MKDLSGKVAAVTGAASGIGRATSIELAGHGCHLALADVDEQGMAETAAQARTRGTTVTTRRLDVADRGAVVAWADEVVGDHGKVNLIVNNAGVALGASVEAMAYEDFDWLIGINLLGVVYGTKAFLPHLKATGDGHVVNISSVFGLLGIPSQSAYNAAKFAVRGFTEALRIELDMERGGVSCTTIHPGGIKTNIARSARLDPTLSLAGGDPDGAVERMERLFITSPERAARSIVRAIRQDKRRAMVGPDAHALNLLARLPPGIYQRLIAAGARRG